MKKLITILPFIICSCYDYAIDPIEKTGDKPKGVKELPKIEQDTVRIRCGL